MRRLCLQIVMIQVSRGTFPRLVVSPGAVEQLPKPEADGLRPLFGLVLERKELAGDVHRVPQSVHDVQQLQVRRGDCAPVPCHGIRVACDLRQCLQGLRGLRGLSALIGDVGKTVRALYEPQPCQLKRASRARSKRSQRLRRGPNLAHDRMEQPRQRTM